MTRVLLAIALMLGVASSRPATAGEIWHDTVFGGGPDGQANAIVTDGARVYAAGFVSTPTSSAGLVRGYDARTGTVLWEDRLETSGAQYEFHRLATDGNRLFATAIVVHQPDAGGFAWLVRAYDARTGNLLWEDARDDGQSGEAVGVTTANGRVFVTGAGSETGARSAFVVRAYDAATGDLLWQDFPGDSGSIDVGFDVATSGGRVFAAGRIGNTLHVAAYAQDDGRLLWTQDEDRGSPHVDGLVTADGRLFVAALAGGDLLLRAFDAPTGRVLWKDREAPPSDGTGSYAIFDVGLAADADLAVVGRRHWDGSAALIARDAATGALAWRDDDPEVTRSLQIGGGRVFGVSGASELLARAFALEGGRPAWSSPRDPDGSALALARSGSLVFVAGVAGPKAGTFHVAAFDTSTRGGVRPVVPGGRRLPITR